MFKGIYGIFIVSVAVPYLIKVVAKSILDTKDTINEFKDDIKG